MLTGARGSLVEVTGARGSLVEAVGYKLEGRGLMQKGLLILKIGTRCGK
jgi:hypothetical protein